MKKIENLVMPILTAFVSSVEWCNNGRLIPVSSKTSLLRAVFGSSPVSMVPFGRLHKPDLPRTRRRLTKGSFPVKRTATTFRGSSSLLTEFLSANLGFKRSFDISPPRVRVFFVVGNQSPSYFPQEFLVVLRFERDENETPQDFINFPWKLVLEKLKHLDFVFL